MAARSVSALLTIALASLLSAEQEPPLTLTLQEAGARKTPNYEPVHAGQRAVVTGVAVAKAIQVLDYALLPIEQEGYGFFLSGPPEQLSAIAAGEHVRATGTISQRGGLAVLLTERMEVTARGLSVSPVRTTVHELRGFRHLGRLVVVEATVDGVGENAGGEYLQLVEPDNVRVFLPQWYRSGEPALARFSAGDRVRVLGIASQYCPLRPHNRLFQILISNPASVTLVQPRWPVSPGVLTAVVAAALTMLGLWWARDRRMVMQRQQMRTLHALSEDILAATSPTEILKMLRQVLTPLYDLSAVRLYIADRNASQLDMVPTLENPRTESISLESPDAASGPALCFRNRTLLAIPDTRRTPFGAGEHEMRSVMFIPMFARKELAGVLELARSGRAHAFTVDEQTAAQHVANQVAMAIRLLDQQSIREQLFRSEKLAAAGKLTSAVANELREPLDSISRLSAYLSARLKGSSEEADIQTVGMEARRASDIVARLVSFARPEEAEAAPVELHPLLSGLIEFRLREGGAQAVKFQARLAADCLTVLGSQGQLEKVFLDLLVHAEQSAGESTEKTVYVNTSRAANRALIEIVYTTGPEEPGRDPFADGRSSETGALGLDMCRGIVQSHGGEIRTVPGAGEARFVVELPLQETPANLQQAAAATALPGRSLTVLIVEPDLQVQRQLLRMISSRGHRVVPVGSAEEGADLIERLRFDFVLCAVKLPGLNWVEFFERVRRHIGGFALLTEGYDADLSRAFAEGEGHILAKPVEEFQLARLLDGAAIEQTTSARK